MTNRLSQAVLLEHIKAADQRAREYSAAAASDRTRTFLAVLCGRLDYHFPDVADALAKAAGMEGTSKRTK